MTLRFRNEGKILTLWVEKTYDDGLVIGWCPELANTMVVHPKNIVHTQASVKGVRSSVSETDTQSQENE